MVGSHFNLLLGQNDQVANWNGNLRGSEQPMLGLVLPIELIYLRCQVARPICIEKHINAMEIPCSIPQREPLGCASPLSNWLLTMVRGVVTMVISQTGL